MLFPLAVLLCLAKLASPMTNGGVMNLAAQVMIISFVIDDASLAENKTAATGKPEAALE